jgi:acetolactate synthase-1/2/3 large subunit
MIHLPELETAVRYELPLLVVIFNDQLLGAEYHTSVAKGLNADLARVITRTWARSAERSAAVARW